MSGMTRVLIVAQPTVGHVTALITIGRRLLASGADVRFALPFTRLPRIPLPSMIATALRLPKAVEAAGLRFVPLAPSLAQLAYGTAMPWTAGATELRLAARLITAGSGSYVRQLEAELDREGADVIVADFGFVAGLFVAERRRVPHVAFFHSGLPFPEGGEYPFTGGAVFSRSVDARIAPARRSLGLPPAAPGFFDRPYSPDLNLLATAPALEGRTTDYGPTTRWVGPCVDGRVETASFPLERLRPDAVKVYLSLGTVFNGRADRFRAVIRGLTAPGVQLVVSAGESFAALESMAGPDLLIFPWVPQLAVLRSVDFVVSHGGNNTVNEALMAGRPLLVLPIGGEQEANARRVERLGAGIRLERAPLGPESVREAFVRLTQEHGPRLRGRSRSRRHVPGDRVLRNIVSELRHHHGERRDHPGRPRHRTRGARRRAGAAREPTGGSLVEAVVVARRRSTVDTPR
ncbi:MAG: glycosyltransferase, partial [Deltaproteobacteria bacterium]